MEHYDKIIIDAGIIWIIFSTLLQKSYPSLLCENAEL